MCAPSRSDNLRSPHPRRRRLRPKVTARRRRLDALRSAWISPADDVDRSEGRLPQALTLLISCLKVDRIAGPTSADPGGGDRSAGRRQSHHEPRRRNTDGPFHERGLLQGDPTDGPPAERLTAHALRDNAAD